MSLVTVIYNGAIARGHVTRNIGKKSPAARFWARLEGPRFSAHAFYYHTEGELWARGWHTDDARALQTACALSRPL